MFLLHYHVSTPAVISVRFLYNIDTGSLPSVTNYWLAPKDPRGCTNNRELQLFYLAAQRILLPFYVHSTSIKTISATPKMIQVDTSVQEVSIASSWTNLGKLKLDSLDSTNSHPVSSQFTQVKILSIYDQS